MKTEIKCALFFVILSFVWNCGEFAIGLHKQHINIHPYFTVPFYILLTLVTYYYALLEKREETGHITFSKALITGLILTGLILIINPIFMYIFYEYVNPDFLNTYMLHDIQYSIKTPEEAKEYYILSNFMIRGTIYRFIMGIAATILVYLVMSKNIPDR